MQSLWAPPPVFALFRRIVNVVSSLSISQHYLLGKSPHQPDASEPRNVVTPSHVLLRPLEWLGWLNREREQLAYVIQSDADAMALPPRYPPPSAPRPSNTPLDIIHRLMNSPLLFDPVRAPRNPVALCHGLYGFDVRGPESFPMLRHHYWSNVLAVLRHKIGAEVIVTSVPATGSVASRSRSLHNMLCEQAPGQSINFMAHSMGGLDCRHLISHLKPTEYKPVSLTTIATPHRGSPFMDWCAENIGIGKLKQKEHGLEDFIRDLAGHPHQHAKSAPQREAEDASPKSSFSLSLASLPSSFTTLLLSLLDSPAYANLTSTYLNTVFNPHTPDDPRVRYFSVAGRTGSMSIWHPLWLPKMVIDGYEARERERLGDQWNPLEGGSRWGNDGLVTVQSARWGEFLGIMEECDHWELRGARGIELDLWGGGGGGGGGGGDSAAREGWSLRDWGRFVRVWKREEKKAKEVGAAMSEQLERRREERERGETRAEPGQNKDRERDRDNGHDFADDVVKASTEKVSAVFDWIVDQAPNSGDETAPAPTKTHAQAEAERSAKKTAEKSDLATKADLERFYVALCRKLYDEGL